MKQNRLWVRLGFVVIALGTLWLTVCSRQPPLTVGVHPWVGYEPLYISRELKWLPDSIQIHDHQTLAQSLAELKTGEAAAACMTLDEMLRARASGMPLSAALVFDVSAGADVVVARAEIKTLSELAHKRIGFDPSALGGLVFEKLLEHAGLSASAVVQVNVPPDRQLQAWRNNEVDAVISYEPMATALRHEGGHYLLDSRQMPDTIIDVLAVRRDRPEVFPQVKVLAASHFRALDHMRTHQQDFLFRVSNREGLPPEDAQRMLAGVAFPSLIANRSYLIGNDARLLHAARMLSGLMVRRGLLQKEDTLDDLILPGALPDEGR